ncbi:FeoB-associated Cys-rich membrane protein [Terasakiella sp. SH-1]|uniref:FeoB-associated Cys-rich membrane protein n=1 Tax=Terasakiella sp. SH-1 TaxID=2560057 RepID=UPI001073EED9|nr:FeoB-associated Cys-rich membrane protein [Terasakiella sp. SH-1]
MEALILTIIFAVCVFLAMRHIRTKFNPSDGCGSGCGGCSSQPTCSTTEKK